MEWSYGKLETPSNFVGELETDPDSAPFWEGLAVGEIRVQHCNLCGTYRFPPGPFCLNCGSGRQVYVALNSTPRLFSWIVVNRSTHEDMPAPYAVAVVEYEEGVRLPGALRVHADVRKLDIGMPVKITIETGRRPFIAVHVGEGEECNLSSADRQYPRM